MIGSKKTLVLAVVVGLTLASVASAQGLHLTPSSALIYPLFDSTPGAGTVICVTNTNKDFTYCEETDYRVGDILVHYQYIAGDDCLEFDRYEFLTPGDTLCVLADLHNPESDQGFLVVSVAEPSTGEKIFFDHLIGSAIVVQSDLNFLWSYTPYGFHASGGIDPNPCIRHETDHDGDGAMDFDGNEYAQFPESLMLDSFFEERNNFSNQLTLMSTAGQDYINEVNVWVFNNIETRYSRTLKFVCWWNGPLSEITQVVTDLQGDPEEMGHPPVETGWVKIEGNRLLDLAGNPVVYPPGHPEAGDIVVPPLLGVFAQFISSTDFAAGRPLQVGHANLDGLEILNGNGE